VRPRIILAIARKDALDLLLNKSTLGGLLFPILLSLVWLLISNVVGNNTTDILVYNLRRSNVVQVVMAAFPSPEVTQAGSAGEVPAAFDSKIAPKNLRYPVGLVIPESFDDDL